MPPFLREKLRESLAAGDEAQGHTISALQRDVGRGLERLRVPSVSELVTREGYSIDFGLVQVRAHAYLPALPHTAPCCASSPLPSFPPRACCGCGCGCC